MARKKVVNEVEAEEDGPKPIQDINEQIAKEIEKDFGKGIMVTGNDIVEREKVIIPVSPAIDSILGGGIPEGSWVVLTGAPKCGKSSTALWFAKNCQKPEYGHRNIYYLNVEGRLKKRDLKGISEMDLNKFHVIESTEDHILSSQDYLKTAEKILLSEKRCVVIIDSLSALCEERQLAGGVGTQTRGGGAQLIAQFTSQMANVVPVKNNIVINVLHVMANTSGFGANTFEKGGRAIQYQVDVKLRAEEVKKWTLLGDENSHQIGQKVLWKAYSTAIIAPGRSCESYIRYGKGIDELQELMIGAKDLGLIDLSGSWYTCDFMKNHLDVLNIKEWNDNTAKEHGLRVQGEAKLREILDKNPEWVECLKKEVAEW